MKLKLISLLFLFITVIPAQAQEKVEMASAWTESGKIWVVIGVIGIILAGLLIYVALTDRKISKLEKEIRNNLKR